MDDRFEDGGGTTATIDFAALPIPELTAFRHSAEFDRWMSEVPIQHQSRIVGYIDALIEHVPADQ